MTRYILHGGFTREDNELNNSFYRALTQDQKEGATILLCYFSRGDDEDKQSLFEDDKNRILKETELKEVNFVLAKKENFSIQVQEADVVYFRGGDTKKLLLAAQESLDSTELLKNKTVAGSSAGAYLISTWFISASTARVGRGLGLLPLRVSCHHKSDRFIVGDEDYKKFIDTHPELELLELGDFEWREFIVE